MKIEDFVSLLEEFEVAVINNGLWPKELIICPKIMKSVFPIKIVSYKLPLTAEMVPVLEGKEGEFFIRPMLPPDHVME